MKKFQLKGKTWRLSFRKYPNKSDKDALGNCEFNERHIYIAKHLQGDELTGTIIHELTHAALFEAHLRESSGLDSKTEEIVCDAVEDMILTLFDIQFKRSRKKQNDGGAK